MKYFLLLLFFISFQLLSAQAPEKALEKLHLDYPQEKVVLSFSKPAYLAGETVHFKAYVLSGYEASFLSGNLYTELYDREKKLIDKQIIPLYKGAGSGSYALPAHLAEDVYYLRAYTRWMLNFSPSFQHLTPLRIYNPYSSQSLRPKPVQWQVKAAAEGGTLVAGKSGNIAVRLYAEGSLPASWSGKLVNATSNAVVSDITVYNNEIGQARFIPEAGEAYKIVVTDGSGTIKEAALPPVKAEGILLQVVADEKKLRYGISFKNSAASGVGYKLLGSISQQPVFIATVARAGEQVGGTLDIDNLPAGVLQLTLFDEKGTPVTERLCFLHQQDLQTSSLAVTTDTFSTAPKGYNHWQLAADSAAWTTYAISVTDAALADENNFLSDVFLRSDFTTPSRQAAWYFEGVDPVKKAALDALLLTETWQRFQWSDVLASRFPAIRFQPDQLLSFSGTVMRNKKLQPLREMNLIVQGADSSIGFLQVKTDSTGSFALQNYFFTDSLKVYYQPVKQKLFEGDLSISLEPLNRFQPFTGSFPQTEWTTGPRSRQDSLPLVVKKAVEQRANELLMAEKSKVLEEVVVTAKARNATQELDKKLSSALFAGGDAMVFDFVNENQMGAMAYNNILDWLQGRVPGYAVANQNGTLVATIRGTPVNLFIDEMRVEPDFINSISVADIAMIKVFRNSFLGSIGGGSAIAIYTRRGDMPTANNTPSLPTYVLQGYRKLLPHFSPDYSVSTNRTVSDQRYGLYYNSLPQPAGAALKIPVVFYNNDVTKRYRLNVTGFTADGGLVFFQRLLPQ